MRLPNNKGYAGRVGTAVRTLIGSRFFVGVSGLCLTAFLAHVLSNPSSFPQFAIINFQTMGILPPLPPAPELPSLDGRAGQVARDAAEGAKQAGLPYVQAWLAEQDAKVKAYFAANPGAVVAGNYIGLAASTAATLWGVYLLAGQRKMA